MSELINIFNIPFVKVLIYSEDYLIHLLILGHQLYVLMEGHN